MRAMKRRNNKKNVLIPLFITLQLPVATAQKNIPPPNRDKDVLRAVFYNMENFFHPENDSLKDDEKYTQSGVLYWNEHRYKKKAIQHYKTLIHIGGWSPPDIINVCEIENKKVMQELKNKTPLKKFNYKIIHKESPDKRGIDVAMIYRKKTLRIIDKKWHKVDFEKDYRTTRDILYVKGIKIRTNDTINIFVNHWPSRYGGKLKTEPKRIKAAKILRKKVDSLNEMNKNAKILIMGDFNDTHRDKSIKKVLSATTDTSKDNKELYDLT
ncbi:MAG: hypothetical protein ABEH43_11370, partial [Flavobacteriales bacterium]